MCSSYVVRAWNYALGILVGSGILIRIVILEACFPLYVNSGSRVMLQDPLLMSHPFYGQGCHSTQKTTKKIHESPRTCLALEAVP